MKNRSRMDIAANLLTIALAGSKKTRMMYDALVSFAQLKNYLDLLVDAGLLEYSEVKREYRTTENGKHFLEVYKELSQMMTTITMATSTTTTAATATTAARAATTSAKAQ